jgi:hypothetical protein
MAAPATLNNFAMSRSKDLLIAGLACASLALAFVAFQQRREIQRLAPSRAAKPAATVTIHSTNVRNLAVVPPISSAHIPEDLRAAADANDIVFPPAGAPENRPRRRSALARLVDNPEFLQALGQHRQATLDSRFADLFRRLNLSGEELARFKRLLADKENVILDVVAISENSADGPLTPDSLRSSVRAAQTQVENAIRDSLGHERYALYRDYERTLAHRATVIQLEQRLSYSEAPLTSAQADMLVSIMVARAPTEGSNTAPAVSIVLAAGAAPVPLLQTSAPGSRLTDEIIAQAQTVLAPAQVAALREIQTEQQAAMRAAELVRETYPAAAEIGGLGLTWFLQ